MVFVTIAPCNPLGLNHGVSVLHDGKRFRQEPPDCAADPLFDGAGRPDKIVENLERIFGAEALVFSGIQSAAFGRKPCPLFKKVIELLIAPGDRCRITADLVVDASPLVFEVGPDPGPCRPDDIDLRGYPVIIIRRQHRVRSIWEVSLLRWRRALCAVWPSGIFEFSAAFRQ